MTQRLGWRQNDMLNFIRKYANGDRQRFFHIARDKQSRNVALSLVKRELIRIVNNSYECWVVALA
jgi:hypothetical protein